MGPYVEGILGVGAVVLCTGESSNAQLGLVRVRRQIANSAKMGINLSKSMKTGD